MKGDSSSPKDADRREVDLRRTQRVALPQFWAWVYGEIYRDWSLVRDERLPSAEGPLDDTEGTTWVSGAIRGDVPRTEGES